MPAETITTSTVEGIIVALALGVATSSATEPTTRRLVVGSVALLRAQARLRDQGRHDRRPRDHAQETAPTGPDQNP